jgi:hypothetical protein
MAERPESRLGEVSRNTPHVRYGALVTFEGTAKIQTLIVGRDITGQSAFA